MKRLALFAMLVLSPALAQAQNPKQGAQSKEQQAPSVKVTRGAGGQKVYRITEGIVIEGKIQKPEAFYVLQRSTINYDWETLKQDFVPKILDSVTHSPF